MKSVRFHGNIWDLGINQIILEIVRAILLDKYKDVVKHPTYIFSEQRLRSSRNNSSLNFQHFDIDEITP